MALSEKAYQEATGQSKEYWFKKLKDKEQGQVLSHKELAEYLATYNEVSFWWAQSITVDYEKKNGRRVTGETGTSGFQIGVSKTLHCTVERGWQILLSPEGQSLWLQPDVELKIEKGASCRREDGFSAKVRVWNPNSHLRLSWQLSQWDQPSILQIRCLPKAEDRCIITFHQEKLPDQYWREQMKSHWKEILIRLNEMTLLPE